MRLADLGAFWAMARDEDTLARMLQLVHPPRLAPAVAVLLRCGDRVAVLPPWRVPLGAVRRLLETPEIAAVRLAAELGVAGTGLRYLARTELPPCDVHVYALACARPADLRGARWEDPAALAARVGYARAWVRALA